ncbi:MAG: hypothetical protein IT247_06020, partial [Bacteroidia bacterium]|nr:hypothetical protein [Bacteroidia bacterium]
MATSIQKAVKTESNASIVLLADKKTKWLSYNLSEKEVAYIHTKLKADERLIVINQFDRLIFVLIPKDKRERHTQLEDLRANGNKICSALNTHKQSHVII